MVAGDQEELEKGLLGGVLRGCDIWNKGTSIRIKPFPKLNQCHSRRNNIQCYQKYFEASIRWP